MPKVKKARYPARRNSPFEDFLERLIVYELTKDTEKDDSTSVSSCSVTETREAGSVISGDETSSECGGRLSPDSAGQSSSTARILSTPVRTTLDMPSSSKSPAPQSPSGRPSVIVENVNYHVDIV